MEWPQVCQTALKFVPYLEKSWPAYMEEIRGVAHGANVDFESILALNVRTEIAYGMFSDGCTALSWKSNDNSFLAQTWDWEIEQKSNLISLHIRQEVPKPTIHMITEGGIIGKIGLNSSGVGVTLNAIKEQGVNFNKLPCHLSLRAVLDSTSRANAVQTINAAGVAAACHLIVADSTGSVGLECTANDIIHMPMAALDGTESDEGVATTHTNHFLYEHPGAKAPPYLEDSIPRLARIRELMAGSGSDGKLTPEKIEAMLMDEKGFPTSICRAETAEHIHTTIFSIVMDLKDRSARVKVGRPIAPDGFVGLRP
ncbi:hypothetical protein FQN54_002296 [Arachnomyces sp. PD_36]|nr:hypothetical protein FQN54_002296 [Arachnomyces sp. PD_36]